MAQPPDDVIKLILNRLKVVDLCQMMLVCKQWNSILNSTKALWRNVELGQRQRPSGGVSHETRARHQEILKIASMRSGYSLEIFINAYDLRDQELLPVMSLLRLSKSTLRKVDLGMLKARGHLEAWKEHGSPLLFFKDFEKLERLNLTDEIYPQVEPIEKGKLAFLAWDEPDQDDEAPLFSTQDVQWLSHLKVLHYQYLNSNTALPVNLLNMLKVCRQSLVELSISSFGDNANENPDGKVITLPSLKFLTIKSPVEFGNYDRLKAPNLKYLKGVFSTLGDLPFKNMVSLSVDLDSLDDLSHNNGLQLLVLAGTLQPHASTLKELELVPDSYGETTLLDSFLSYLQADYSLSTRVDIRCPGLSRLIISRDSWGLKPPKEGFYSKELLAQALLSRRLASAQSSDSSPDSNKYCSRITLFIEKEDFEAFRIEEKKLLAGLSEMEREVVGKTEVRSLEEWRRGDY